MAWNIQNGFFVSSDNENKILYLIFLNMISAFLPIVQRKPKYTKFLFQEVKRFLFSYFVPIFLEIWNRFKLASDFCSFWTKSTVKQTVGSYIWEHPLHPGWLFGWHLEFGPATVQQTRLQNSTIRRQKARDALLRLWTATCLKQGQ